MWTGPESGAWRGYVKFQRVWARSGQSHSPSPIRITVSVHAAAREGCACWGRQKRKRQLGTATSTTAQTLGLTLGFPLDAVQGGRTYEKKPAFRPSGSQVQL
eukprot:g19885.t1